MFVDGSLRFAATDRTTRMIYPDLRFMHAGGDGGPRSTTHVVVIHATDNTASASAEATFAQHRPDNTSAHFYNDEGAVIQALDTSHIAYGCLYHGNQISIQFEMCGLSNRLSDATMRKVAPIVARVCHDWDLPVRKIGAQDVRNGVTGICGHADITAAFPQDHGDHTDPGLTFPWSTFISYVEGASVQISDIDAQYLTWRVEAITHMFDQIREGPEKGANCDIVQTLKRIENELKALTAPSTQAPALSDGELNALAQKVAALLPQPPSAADVAEELAKRPGNG